MWQTSLLQAGIGSYTLSHLKDKGVWPNDGADCKTGASSFPAQPTADGDSETPYPDGQPDDEGIESRHGSVPPVTTSVPYAGDYS